MENLDNIERLFTPQEKEEHKVMEVAKLLVTKDKNLALKTEISDPLNFAVMGAMSEYLKKSGLKKSATLIHNILENHMIYMVSYKRKSRNELIEALRILTENEKNKMKNEGTLGHKLVTPR